MMLRYDRRASTFLFTACAILLVSTVFVAPTRAIEADQVDNFNDEDLHGWRVGFAGPSHPQVALDNGPMGTGDHSLWMMSGGISSQPRLLVINDTPTDIGPWEGDWTAAGITQISMDVRNPNEFSLFMRIGIAGPGGLLNGGSGDTWVTDAIEVAPNATDWQNIVIAVQAPDFHSFGHSEEDSPDIDAALAGVTHMRILHNPAEAFVGEFISGQFYLDNIAAIGATAGVLGDYNGNDIVDAADYVVWRSKPASLINEGASPNVVDNDDYTYWRSRFGATDNLGFGTGTTGVLALATVPEPALWPFVSGLFVFVRVGARRRV